MSRLDRQPKRLQNEVFDRLFKIAEIAKFSKSELKEYEDSLKAYRDIKNSLDTAEEKGRAEGRAEGLMEGRVEGEKNKAVEIAKKLLGMGMSIEVIAETTGLSVDTIKSIC